MENYVGKRIDGRYEIIEIIGVGGMAVVYKAFDNIDHRIVAVKILKDEFLANEDFRRRFKNESKAIAVLSHPNIVKVFDVSYGNMIQYIVMEYVEGISLKEYIEQQGRVNPREAIYYVTQILRALQHAHDKGIVHRDIKPQNIMLISDGTIKVTDFGIARFSRSETRTMTDGAIGSVHYISPEQAKGSHTDAKTDLYSVGVMLYEMLTGTLPFQSDNAVSVALMQLQNDPVKPREINPDIPVGLEQIIIRAMQKNQSDRYQSASEILRDIEEYKKNPNIKFDYSYFTGTQPDQITETDEDIKVATPVVTRAETVIEPLSDDSADDEEDDSAKKKTIAVLCGVLGALVIFAVILISMFLPGSGKINVPNVVGLNFYNQVMNQPAYADFNFEPIIDDESDAEAGTILRQEPASGKADKNSTIKIYISASSTQVEVPDVYGKEYTSADAVIRGKGLETTVVKERNEEVKVGSVIKTYPAKGEMVPAGSTITIYVATSEDVEPVAVPNLIGMTVAQARALLAEAGLTLDTTRTEYRGSAEPAGKIIGHEYIGEMVLPGTRVAVYVSTGKIPETTDETTEEEETEETEEEKTTREKKTTRPTTTKPTTTKPTTTKPTTTKPSTTQPSTTKPSTTQPSTTKPSTTQPTTTEPTTTKPTTTEPTTTQPTTEATAPVQAQDTTQAEQPVNGEQ
ncbi:MAG: Stk1 family PASTA domain-containing Ser/Thr kinase [Ruminococcaceae bacterium]|nr:Stk1 family PASTA domain-containing Ser/Thr kinase [Oscillospiraceae bacterium]